MSNHMLNTYASNLLGLVKTLMRSMSSFNLNPVYEHISSGLSNHMLNTRYNFTRCYVLKHINIV